MSVHTDENTTGALIFYAYIAAALSLSGLICRDLFNEYISRRKESGTQHSRKQSTYQLDRDVQIQTQISTLAALSALSFAVLSHSMLGFRLSRIKLGFLLISLSLSPTSGCGPPTHDSFETLEKLFATTVVGSGGHSSLWHISWLERVYDNRR
jgi:hypothetical protein